jgi:hypothetical protein
MDMGMSLSTAHPTDPFNLPGVKLGDAQVRSTPYYNSGMFHTPCSPHTSTSIHVTFQFAQHSKWQQRGLLALVGVGGMHGFEAQLYLFLNQLIFPFS